MKRAGFGRGQAVTLLVLFIPSVERDGKTRVPQRKWVDAALDTLVELYGRATAYPAGEGRWQNPASGERQGERAVPIHCYVAPRALVAPRKRAALLAFCERLRRETNQEEVGIIIGDRYHAIR